MIKALNIFTVAYLLLVFGLNLAIPAWISFIDGSNQILFTLDRFGQWEVITDIVLYTIGIVLSIFVIWINIKVKGKKSSD